MQKQVDLTEEGEFSNLEARLLQLALREAMAKLSELMAAGPLSSDEGHRKAALCLFYAEDFRAR